MVELPRALPSPSGDASTGRGEEDQFKTRQRSPRVSRSGKAKISLTGRGHRLPGHPERLRGPVHHRRPAEKLQRQPGRHLEEALEPFLHPHVLVIDELGYQSKAPEPLTCCIGWSTIATSRADP